MNPSTIQQIKQM